MDHLKLYGRFIIVYLKSQMEYRFSFFMDIFSRILVFAIYCLGIWILLHRFHSIGGWTFYEILLLYSLNLFSYGSSSIFVGQPMLDLENMVQRGTFDSMLIYPLNPFLHVIFRQFDQSVFGHLILSIGLFFICFQNLNIVWTLSNLVWFILVLAGATLIQAAIIILSGSMSFWFVKSTSVVHTAIYGLRQFIDYPLTIYHKGIQILLTFIVPYGFVTFYPAEYFLNKSGSPLFYGVTLFDPLFQFGTPIVGVIIFILAYRVWILGISRYQSTGS